MEFLIVFFIFPIIVVFTSIIGFILFQKWYVIPIVTFFVFIVLTFTVFNESFFIWVVVYTIISVLISLIMTLFTR